LLGSDDEETFAKLKDLIPKRRAAHVALCQGLRTQKDLATAMRISTTNAKDLYNQMRGEGYVTAATGSKSAGYASTGKPYFVVPKEGPKHDQMITNLFDPLLHISHYVRLFAHPYSNGLADHLYSTTCLRSKSLNEQLLPSSWQLRKPVTCRRP
jgi:hypothetical protein